MKYCYLLILSLSSIFLTAQTENLINYEVTLIGPSNVDHHHPIQVNYYLDYFDFLEEEVDAWLAELKKDLKVIRKRNRKRIENKRPIKSRDYPAWKKNTDIIKDLEQDKVRINKYIFLWENYNYEAPDSVMKVFMEAHDEALCFDLISQKLVLSPKEYSINTFQFPPNLFIWKEYMPKNSFQCPEGYDSIGKICSKEISLELEVDTSIPSIFLIQNKLSNLPFHLDGFKQITCR